MAQRVYEAGELPESGIDASAAFARDHLEAARSILADADCLAIVLPPAGPDHADWRRALARDLARAYAPKRTNVVAGEDTTNREALLTYLANAHGVTGHYLEAHD